MQQLRAQGRRRRDHAALGFCVIVEHARFMAEQFQRRGHRRRRASGATSPTDERTSGAADLAAGRVDVVFTVDLFNEGIDVPNVDTLLLLRPTESATLFLQQLGRGLRRAHRARPSAPCSTSSGNHRREFRFDLRYRALLGGSRRERRAQVEQRLPVPPGGLPLRARSGRSRRSCCAAFAKRSRPTWRASVRRAALARRRVNLSTFLEESGLELDDVYANNQQLDRAATSGRPADRPAGPTKTALLRAVGRLLHVDDDERIDAYREFARPRPPRRRSPPSTNASGGCCGCSSAR